ncbi:MAG TPA: hypothetical protein VF474_11135 [Phenylobacterium sp.]
MGLDLIVESCPKPGHEAEWRRLLNGQFFGDEPAEADVARFQEISIPSYERLGAPRVGYDAEADAWILKTREVATPDDEVATLRDFHGYYVVALVQSDGVPEYTHANLYEGVDETSFRGTFLTMCADVLPRKLIQEAWNHKFPEDALAYGRALLAAAEAASAPPETAPKMGLLARLGLAKPKETMPFAEQVKIVRAAGRWFIFWGERGHAIRAWS